MDYTTQSFVFKLRKVLRYVRLYGFRRTLVKVRAQYHLEKRYVRLPAEDRRTPRDDAHVGIIGCGNFAYSAIAYYLERNHGKVIRGYMDVDIHRAASLFETYSGAYYTDDARRIFDDPRIDLVYIASNHASHAEHAIEALRAGKAVHIEKPHCVNEDQLRRLCRTISETDGRVALGFNRPRSPIGERIRQALLAEEGPAMLNWFVAGHRIDPDHWYFRPEEGGRVLGNLCHWTDFVYRLIPEERRFPITVIPTRAEKSDADVAVTYLFGDGSIAAITFSAKGHTFEGVRERFAAHRGNTLLSMDDFRTLTVERVEAKREYSAWYRDHGHERRIRRSYRLTRGEHVASVSYIWETGLLFLKTREALQKDERVVVESQDAVVPGAPEVVS